MKRLPAKPWLPATPIVYYTPSQLDEATNNAYSAGLQEGARIAHELDQTYERAWAGVENLLSVLMALAIMPNSKQKRQTMKATVASLMAALTDLNYVITDQRSARNFAPGELETATAAIEEFLSNVNQWLTQPAKPAKAAAADHKAMQEWFMQRYPELQQLIITTRTSPGAPPNPIKQFIAESARELRARWKAEHHGKELTWPRTLVMLRKRWDHPRYRPGSKEFQALQVLTQSNDPVQYLKKA